MKSADVVVIGAGVIGLSIAYNLLKKDPALKVVVLEKEMFTGSGSTAVCTGGIRHQFSTATNIQLTLLSLPYFLNFEQEMEYPIYLRQNGYLFVTASPALMESFRQEVQLQNSLGAPTQLLSPKEITGQFPYLDPSGLLGGTYCAKDGDADPYGVVQGYLRKARLLGAKVFTEEPAISIRVVRGRAAGVSTPRLGIDTGAVINAAGPYASGVAALAGVNLPVTPYRRQVFVSEPISSIPEGIPLTADLDTGFYIHREGKGCLLLGGTDKDLSPGFSTAVDWSVLDTVAEAGLSRIPTLEQARITKAYAGLRSFTPDYQAIFGEAGETEGFYCANGFTGHGFMHSPAIGLLMAELVLQGRTNTLDVSPLSPKRFLDPITTREAAIF